jgi:hypothetical protein
MDVINAFPGYEYIDGKNIYRGDDLGKEDMFMLNQVCTEMWLYWMSLLCIRIQLSI